MNQTTNDTKRFRDNLQGEVDGAALYRALAEAEPNAKLSEVYRRLAVVEEAHAELWRKNLRSAGAEVPPLAPSFRTRALAWLARRFGPSFVLPTISILERSDSSAYDAQPEAVSGGLPADERSHARLIGAISGAPGGLTGGSIARLEGRHRAMSGNALRAAVLGANDGLVSNLSLVMGMTGAAASEHVVLVTGLAGLVAGACSMAMGEWLSVNSSRELYMKQIATEAAELQAMPEEELEELVLIYQAKGLGEAEARVLAGRLMANKDTALDTLVREELGIDPKNLGGSPWAAATWSFFLFAIGAVVPVLPFVLLTGPAAAYASIAASALALALIGVATSLFTGRTALFSAMRQVAIGAISAGVTYGIGSLAGVVIGS
jgi:VIT1/CCC1 family predicted Fe2+/Mn2+ transporter